jgi:hypothetical protein
LENLIESTICGNREPTPWGATSTTIGILGENGERLILRLGVLGMSPMTDEERTDEERKDKIERLCQNRCLGHLENPG